MTDSASAFRAARDLLLEHRDDYDRAYAEFRWPVLDEFNWARDWFDRIGGDTTALWVVEEDGSEQKELRGGRAVAAGVTSWQRRSS